MSISYPESYVKMLREREVQTAKCHDILFAALEKISKHRGRSAAWMADVADEALAALDQYQTSIEERSPSTLMAAE